MFIAGKSGQKITSLWELVVALDKCREEKMQRSFSADTNLRKSISFPVLARLGPPLARRTSNTIVNPKMSDPGSRIHPEILQHLHLLLNVPLPRPQSKPEGLPIDKVIEILLQAVKYIRSEKTVSWQLLDGPPDGTLLVTWQSPRKTGFASDGYIYADPERAFSQQARGYVSNRMLSRSYHNKYSFSLIRLLRCTSKELASE